MYWIKIQLDPAYTDSLVQRLASTRLFDSWTFHPTTDRTDHRTVCFWAHVKGGTQDHFTVAQAVANSAPGVVSVLPAAPKGSPT